MSGPLIFVSHSTVKPGKLDLYKNHLRDAIELVDSEEPRMIGFNFYASEDGTDVSTIQVHPDADSLDLHFRIFIEKLQALAFEALDTSEINIYGQLSDTARGMLSQMPDQVPGLKVRFLPVHQGGFLRPQPQ